MSTKDELAQANAGIDLLLASKEILRAELKEAEARLAAMRTLYLDAQIDAGNWRNAYRNLLESTKSPIFTITTQASQ